MADKSKIYEVTSFRGGLSDYEDKGISGSFKFGYNLDIRKEIDSLSCNQALTDEGLLGSQSDSASVSPSASPSISSSLSPSPSISPTPSPSSSESASPSTTPSVSVSLSPSTTPSSSISPSPSPSSGLNTVFEDLILFFVKASNGYVYAFGDKGIIYRRDADAYWKRVYKDSGKIRGAEEKPSSSGKNYLYWATSTVLKRIDISNIANWNNVETVAQNLEPVEWHTMKQVAGSLMIANGEYTAMVGYDDSYTNEALDLVPGNTAKTILERSGRAIIGTHRTGYADKGINSAIDSEVQLAQIGDEGGIYFANMTSGLPVKKFPGGGKTNPAGVCNKIDSINFFEWEQTALSWIDKQTIGNLALFGVYNASSGYGGIYSYGRDNKNHPFVLNLEYLLDVDEIGALTSVDGLILASYRDGTDYGVKAVDSTTKATGVYEGLDFKAPTKNPINITTWKYAEVYCSPLPVGCSIEFWYKINKTGAFIRAYTGAGGTTFNSVGEKKAVFNIACEGEIFEPRLVLNPSANLTPEIYRLRVYFD